MKKLTTLQRDLAIGERSARRFINLVDRGLPSKWGEKVGSIIDDHSAAVSVPALNNVYVEWKEGEQKSVNLNAVKASFRAEQSLAELVS